MVLTLIEEAEDGLLEYAIHQLRRVQMGFE